MRRVRKISFLYDVTISELRANLRLRKRGFRVYVLSTSYLSSEGFSRISKKSNNYYQLKKLIEFFDELQANSLIKFFSDKKCQSLVTIPEVVLTKGKQNCWVGRVWISEELFCYRHPFILPNLITKKLTKH